jgi:hypothetical protein
MVDKFSGMVFVVSLVFLLSFKDMLFITKDIESTATPKNNAATRNQPINLDTDDDDFKSDHDHDHENHQHSHDSDHDDESDFGSGGSEDSRAATTDGEFVKKIPSLKMKSNIQTIKFSFW